MGFQFEQLTLSAQRSLSFIIEDMGRARRDGVVYDASELSQLEGWLNVLQTWSAPLIQSDAGLRGIQRWLETVDEMAP